MPDTPSHDDTFADVFGARPGPAGRGPAAGRSAPDPDEGAGGSAPVPASRRAAREAAERAATAPVPTPGSPDTDAASASAAPAATASRTTAATLDALFTEEADADERQRLAKIDADRRKSRVAGWVVFGVVLALLGGVALGGLWVWTTYEQPIREFMGWTEPKDFEAGIAEGDVTITIVEGDTWASISETLFEAGVTKTPNALYDHLISTGQNPTAIPGVYALQSKMTSAAALEALLDPANKLENTAQLREGLTVAQSLPLLAEAIDVPLADFEAAVADPSAYGVDADSLEGWLFPATYTFDPGVTAQDVVRTLVDKTVRVLDEVGVPVADRHRILTIASIIQREARFEEDFYKVSRVIENRLDPGNSETFGLLQMDSTAQFGYGEHNGVVSSSQAALEDDNPWNTYVHPGLPIGPIANPGKLAIDAALNPADGPWLYFVTVNLETGETVFTETLAQHQAAVAQWREWCAANPDSDCG